MLYSLIGTSENIPLCADTLEAFIEERQSVALSREAPRCILIVEDNPGDVFLMEEALREHSIDCQVTVLCDGEQANDYFNHVDEDPATACPSVILLDLNLPKRSGHSVLSRIRRSNRCRSCPLLWLARQMRHRI